MATLVLVTQKLRILLKFGGVFIGILFIIYLFVKGGVIIQTIFFPKPPPLPKEEFGKLPHISFLSGGNPGIEFIINTIDGKLPIFPSDRINVYKLNLSEPNLLALETARKTLESQDFTENQIKLSDTLYQWSQYRTSVIIQYDIVTSNFSITSDYLTTPSFESSSNMPDGDVIIKDSIAFVSSLNKKSKNIDSKKSKIDYLELQNRILTTATNPSRAKYAKVTLIQKDIDKIPMIYDKPNDSIMSFVVSYPSGFQVLEGSYYNHDPNLEEKSDYPLKNASTALEELKEGGGYVINTQNLTTVNIKNVELRYYLNKNSTNFVMPVIVFTGIDFTAYIEAIPSTSFAN